MGAQKSYGCCEPLPTRFCFNKIINKLEIQETQKEYFKILFAFLL